MEPFIQLHGHAVICKKLFLDLLLHLIYRFLLDQVVGKNGNANKVPALCGRHLLHCDLFEQILYFLFQL